MATLIHRRYCHFNALITATVLMPMMMSAVVVMMMVMRRRRVFTRSSLGVITFTVWWRRNKDIGTCWLLDNFFINARPLCWHI